MQNQLTSLSEKEEQEKEKTGGGVVLLDEEAVEKMYSYMELNYGRSYLNELERRDGSISKALPGGACGLQPVFYGRDPGGTGKGRCPVRACEADGGDEPPLLHQNRRVTRQNIEVLTEILNHALMTRNEEEIYASEYGRIVPSRLWKVRSFPETARHDPAPKA